MQIQTFHPLPGAIFNSGARNAGNNRVTTVTVVSVNEGKYEKFCRRSVEVKKKQQSETQPFLFPLAMPRRRSQFPRKWEILR